MLVSRIGRPGLHPKHTKRSAQQACQSVLKGHRLEDQEFKVSPRLNFKFLDKNKFQKQDTV